MTPSSLSKSKLMILKSTRVIHKADPQKFCQILDVCTVSPKNLLLTNRKLEIDSEELWWILEAVNNILSLAKNIKCTKKQESPVSLFFTISLSGFARKEAGVDAENRIV